MKTNNKNKKSNMRLAFLGLLALGLPLISSARENQGQGGRKPSTTPNVAAACNAGSAQTDLDINNVRTRILTGGDMWWDLSNPRYEIPKGSGDHSIFAGSLWIGGIDAGGQLKVAAMTYRQSGNDYWPGPLDTVNVTTDQVVCDQFDKHFRVKRSEVEKFYTDFLNNQVSSIPQSLLNWPGNGNPAYNHAKYLAPFYDNNGDGVYNPYDGDYPDYDITGTRGCSARLFGDETLWWVFNDKGNVHSESGAEAIGLEIHSQAFAFTTNDEVNDMTFYQYKVINRSTFQLNGCYFGQWVDPDLGQYNDDYVGCNVLEGLGFCYNGDNQDGTGGPGDYGAYLPAVGIDFFQGPIADLGDGIDNDRDCLVDEPGEQIIMSKFVYYDNNFTVRGNPENGTHIYNYLSGFWKDGLPLTYGGNAYNTGGPICNFMFPGSSDQTYGWGTGGNCQNPASAQPPWDEVSAGNVPADRRFLQSCGPFTLKPGAVNIITVGAVWATTTLANNNVAALNNLLLADKKAQALFDNCFAILNGPDAPTVTIQELDKELIFYLTNSITSNNYLEGYSEKDPIITSAFPGKDDTYDFQGYQVWQLKDETVSQSDLYNPDKARLVFQCDVKDTVDRIINFEFDKSLNANVPKEMVDGANKGVFHSFKITEDQFATGDKRLVNHKTYYFMAMAYGFNNYKFYIPDNQFYVDGQKLPYKPGRRNIKSYKGIPHIPSPEAGGTQQNSTYGMGPKITRIEGSGNGGMDLDLTDESVSAILNSSTHSVREITYKNSKGPVNIKVVDPLNVIDGNFELKFSGTAATSNWTLRQIGGNTIASDKTIALEAANEQLIPEWGISVSITQVYNPGNPGPDKTNGFIDGTMSFADPTKRWLTGLADLDGFSNQNWIRSGTQNQTGACIASYNDYVGVDNDGVYERILGGTWAPYRLTGATEAGANPCYQGGPCWNSTFASLSQMANLASVDIVITADKSKWTRCVVLETCDAQALSQPHPTNPNLNARKLDLRIAPSVDKNGNPTTATSPSNNPNDANFISHSGMGWFPGYAINVETGERLNIAFGENSSLVTENGRDMQWNPTRTINATPSGAPRFGGMHYIYVFGHNNDDTTNFIQKYDFGSKIRRLLDNNNTPNNPIDNVKRTVFRDAMWVNIPLLRTGFTLNNQSQIPCDVKIRLRVKKAYKRGFTTATDTVTPSQNFNRPMYRFNTSDLHTHKSDMTSAKDALELINVVPNPYYAYSGYEKNQVDTRIKITNLPDKCTIRIFTLNGTLIRKITKDDATKTSLDWDLKNHAGIPIASGMYIIHVEAKDNDGNVYGEKILKWFGVMRPVDLDTF
jgi:hypothetical protein